MTATVTVREKSRSNFSIETPRDDLLLRIPPQAHTLAGFRKWALSEEVPEKLPLAFINGEVFIDMGKEEISSHSLVKTECGRVLANLNVEFDFGYIFINGVLVSNVAAKVSNNPDLVAISHKALEGGNVRYIEDKDRFVEIVGSPDLVVEIVSNSSVRKDNRDLRSAYHLAKIPEYWLIDARGDDLFFQILHWRKAAYAPAKAQDKWQKSRVFDRDFRLTRQRNKAGIWSYMLNYRDPAK